MENNNKASEMVRFPSMAWFRMFWAAFARTVAAQVLAVTLSMTGIAFGMWGWIYLNIYLDRIGVLPRFGLEYKDPNVDGPAAGVWMILEIPIIIMAVCLIIGMIDAIDAVQLKLQRQAQPPVKKE